MHHIQFDFLEAIHIYSTSVNQTNQYYSTSRTLTYQYNVVKLLPLIKNLELMMATDSDLLMVVYLEIHFELEIETQLGLLEEMIWDIQLAPLMVLYCWMGKSLGGLLSQNRQRICRTGSHAVLSCTCPHYKFRLHLYHIQFDVLEAIRRIPSTSTLTHHYKVDKVIDYDNQLGTDDENIPGCTDDESLGTTLGAVDRNTSGLGGGNDMDSPIGSLDRSKMFDGKELGWFFGDKLPINLPHSEQICSLS